jgi:hypothetical protein
MATQNVDVFMNGHVTLIHLRSLMMIAVFGSMEMAIAVLYLDVCIKQLAIIIRKLTLTFLAKDL